MDRLNGKGQVEGFMLRFHVDQDVLATLFNPDPLS